MWNVEYTDEFENWWNALNPEEQEDVDASVGLLIKKGPNLPFPYSSGIKRSRHKHLRELRIQHNGLPYRVLYAFNPRRTAILLLGGNKIGDNRWYIVNIPRADKLYEEHINELKREDFKNDKTL
jgi:hypothetical protein